MSKKKHVNLRDGMVPYMRVNMSSDCGKVISAMLQKWNHDARQWQDVRPLSVKEDGTIVYSVLPEETPE